MAPGLTPLLLDADASLILFDRVSLAHSLRVYTLLALFFTACASFPGQ